MLAALGKFIFRLQSAPFQELQQQIAWRHPSNSRVLARPAHQFIGPDEETVTLAGLLLPELTGGWSNIEELKAMGNTGQSYPLIAGDGTIQGMFIIESLNTTRSTFFADGTARKIDFTLNLKRVDDSVLISNPIAKALNQNAQADSIGADGKPGYWKQTPASSSPTASNDWTVIDGQTIRA